MKYLEHHCFPSWNTSCSLDFHLNSNYVNQCIVFLVHIYNLCADGVWKPTCHHLLKTVFKQLHTPTNLLILSLAGSDFLVGICVMPVESVRRINSCFYVGKSHCRIFHIIISILVSVSLINIVLVAIDRYFDRVWSTPVYVQNNNEKNITPCIVILMLYVRILTVALRQAKSISNFTKKNLKSSRKSEVKATKTLSTIVFVYFICWVPWYIGMLNMKQFQKSSVIVSALLCLFYANSCINQFKYAISYPWFRRSVKLIVSLKILQTANWLFPEDC